MQNKYLRLMRVHQPVGIFLLLWPGLIGLGLASRGYPDLKMIIVFIIGSILMRSAGCIVNDLADRKFDKEVERTKNRPLVSGEINSNEALKLLGILLVLSGGLLFFLNKLAILISLSSLLLVVIYPYCKRFTFWPQLVLGFTFNIGALIAWAQVQNTINSPAIALYSGLIFWTLGYDTIYAHQDREDDLKIGVKSTAILFGNKTRKYLHLFYTMTATLLTFAGVLSGAGVHYLVILCLPIALLYWQINSLDIDNPSNCLRRFKVNILVGALVFIASLAARGSFW